MSTFTIKHKKKLNRSAISIVIFLGVIIVFVLAVNYTSDASLSHQEEALNNAIERDIMMCYAQKGYYPPSLDYIKEHYGLTYDSDTFFVSYQPVADNIYPAYSVIRHGGAHE